MALRKILHISDIHCSRTNLEKVSRLAEGVDAVVFTGDLQCDGGLVEVLAKLHKKVLAVTGNMDDTYIARLLEDYGISIESEVVYVDGWYFAGVSGREPVTSLRRVRQLVRELNVESSRLIVVSHHPPKGVVDKAFIGLHIGLYELRVFDEEVKPRLHLCGHVHESRGVGRLGETVVVNAGPLKKGFYAMVDVEAVKVELGRL